METFATCGKMLAAYSKMTLNLEKLKMRLVDQNQLEQK